MNNEKKLQVIIDDEQVAEARAAITANLKEEYNKSTQDWAKVEESMMRWQKLTKEFGNPALAVFYIEPEDEALAVDTCRDFWPDAVIESGSGEHDVYGFCHYVQVTFGQLSTTDK
jgi:uncharacterized protein (DUF427 family)